ncbi:MAG TPA: Zn-dependent alcohol dehydrogenase [Planctomycetota bacterium]|jgi:S-(hydroxymethyl)glutathione dehydrogenase/alcohol dehydrogenase|nr:Zn-dependent alcohol dehydrogenase [Planctomycetota bacterium]
MAIPAQAVITDGKGRFRVESILVGPPQAGEVRVDLKASGVCHTDHKFLFRRKLQILGHEGAGVVRDVGRGVRRVKPGDRVLLNWAIPCGRCFQCQRGAENICERPPEVPAARFRWKGRPVPTAFRLGTMSTTTVVPEAACVPIGVPIPDPSACILGCGVMTGYGSVMNVAQVKRGESVAVIGTGGVGLSVIQGARIARAKTIVGIDLNPARLRMARRFGATHTIRARRTDAGLLRAAGRARALCEGRGADYAFECTSVPALCAAPLAFVRHGGTAVQLSGTEEPVTVNFELFEWDKVYINPLYGRCRPAVDMPKLLDLYAKGKLLLDEMVTRTYPIGRVHEAFDDMLSGRNAKGVLVMS